VMKVTGHSEEAFMGLELAQCRMAIISAAEVQARHNPRDLA